MTFKPVTTEPPNYGSDEAVLLGSILGELQEIKALLAARPVASAGPRPQRNSTEDGITEKQGKALWAISGGGKKFSLNSVCVKVFGKAERDLTKKEASQLIDGLNNGSIDPNNPTLGAEAVASAFGAVVQRADETQGYNGKPF